MIKLLSGKIGILVGKSLNFIKIYYTKKKLFKTISFLNIVQNMIEINCQNYLNTYLNKKIFYQHKDNCKNLMPNFRHKTIFVVNISH